MSRPARQPYLLADGTQVPSVTTVINRFKDAGGLIHWAWKEGHEGRDYRDSRDTAADAGTLAHRMVEADIRGRAPYADPMADPDTWKRATQAFDNYREWRRQTHLEPVRSEVRLVSEKYRFGGTLDAMLVQGRLSLGDWKTGPLYPDHLIQVAAYGLLWSEAYPDQPITGGYHLLHFAKDNADFAHRHFAELADAEEMFLVLRRAYDLDKALKARVR